ncbi:hypothetical protein GCM10012275_43620 [Longimycelium tulufanense]|uniref:Lipoprotein n=2 Tax=Longimycelium tulufanense TaxID=907463 RepID=A0A8J3FW25_9PSEU|nr:hypothetical protein GCM10012275_43620 [Longimycelium tulufanense]
MGSRVCAGVVGLVLLMAGCSSAPPAVSPETLPTPTSVSAETGERPAVPQRVDPPLAQGRSASSVQSRDLEALLRSVLREANSEVEIADSANATWPVKESKRSGAGLLVRDQEGRYGAVSVEVTEPAISAGNAECDRGHGAHCQVRRMQGGTAVVYDYAKDGGTIRVEWFRPDKSVPIFVYSSALVTRDESLFWNGGSRSPQPPLTTNQALDLAEKTNAQR